MISILKKIVSSNIVFLVVFESLVIGSSWLATIDEGIPQSFVNIVGFAILFNVVIWVSWFGGIALSRLVIAPAWERIKKRHQ